MKYRSSFVALALIAASATTCLGQYGTTPPVVTWVANQGSSTATISAWNSTGGLNNNGGWDVTLHINNPGGTVEVTVGSNNGEPIRNLTVDFNDETEDVELTVKGRTEARSGNISNIDMLDVSQTGHGDLIIEEIMCRQVIGGIRAHRIISIDVTKDIGQDQGIGGDEYFIELVTPTSGSADIEDLIIRRNLFADIKGDTASDEIGTIGAINVTDNIGTASYPTTIEANTINNIIADNIFADVTLDTTGTNGKVRRIQTRTGFDFVGRLTMSEFHSTGGTGTPGVWVGGDLDANLNILDLNVTGEIVVTDVFTTGNLINIDGDLAGDITLGDSGLVGQIICNSANGGDTWTGTVKVGGTTLTDAPHYTQTGLGGGAVGLVGFSCHLQDSVPAYSGPTSPTLSAPFKVTLRHYGPVIWDIDESPIKVMFCDLGPNCDFDTDVSNDFEVTSTPNGLRHVVLEPKSGITPAVGHYHISPKNELNCDDTTANRPDVDNYTYNVEYLG